VPKKELRSFGLRLIGSIEVRYRHRQSSLGLRIPATLEGHLKYTSLLASGLSHQEGTAGRRKATYSLFVGFALCSKKLHGRSAGIRAIQSKLALEDSTKGWTVPRSLAPVFTPHAHSPGALLGAWARPPHLPNKPLAGRLA